MRRRNNEPCISLFSFQDVMAAIIGMLFIIVLMMSLNIMDKKADANTLKKDVLPETEFKALQQKVQNRDEEIQEAQHALEALSDRMVKSTDGDVGLLEDVKSLSNRIKFTYQKIEQAQRDVEKKTGEIKSKNHDILTQTRELENMKRRISVIKNRLNSGEVSARVAYILDTHPNRLEPWLLEITDHHLRLSTKDGLSTVLEFSVESFEARKEQFRAWLGNQDNCKIYFLVLLKPSGYEHVKEIIRLLRKKDFDIGLDVLPEDWKPF